MILIPKIIHFVWIGPNKMPEMYIKNIQSYKEKNQDWVIKVWNNKNLLKIKNKFAYSKMTSWAAKTDILRLEILYQYGGIYTDIDSVCYKELDSLIDNLTCFGMCGNDGRVANGTLGCTKRHPAFKKLINSLENNVYRLKEGRINKKKGTHVFWIAGEHYITPILKKFKDFKRIDEGKNKGIRRYICTPHEKDLSDCYIYHQLAKSWHNKMRIRL